MGVPAAAPITVRLTPRARADRILGVEHDARGLRVLKVAVAAPPVDGAANAALLALLAKHFGLPKSAVTLVSGASARTKRVALAGDPMRIAATLRALETASPR
ncbi:MAG: DUF167 domain-containing protein [Proteobacteria bacterium]|nr:DUF167 domain-containing protein [Pseudomonadota bacterium]